MPNLRENFEIPNQTLLNDKNKDKMQLAIPNNQVYDKKQSFDKKIMIDPVSIAKVELSSKKNSNKNNFETEGSKSNARMNLNPGNNVISNNQSLKLTKNTLNDSNSGNYTEKDKLQDSPSTSSVVSINYLSRLKKSKAWLKSQINSWIKAFTDENKRPPDETEKSQIEEIYFAYKIINEKYTECKTTTSTRESNNLDKNSEN
jgi:hypothetical protein